MLGATPRRSVKRNEEQLEICCGVSIRGRCDGRQAVTVETAVLVVMMAMAILVIYLPESRAVLKERVGEGEKHILVLVLARVDEGHDGAPDGGPCDGQMAIILRGDLRSFSLSRVGRTDNRGTCDDDASTGVALQFHRGQQ